MAGIAGSATVTVTVEDGGLDNNLSTTADNAQIARVFDVMVNPVAAMVTAVEVNGGRANRSGLASLTLQLSKAVTLSGPDALRLWDHTAGAPVGISRATLANNGSNAVTWDFSSVTMPTGYISATIGKAAGLAETYTTLFPIQPGDSTGDARVNFGDFGELASAFNTVAGIIYGPGDMDGNGNVDFGDFGILANTFNQFLVLPEIDFGDAGGSFPTRLPIGARHILGSGLSLGSNVDGEPDGQPDARAAGDGADEDGVTFGTLRAGANEAAITVNATVPAAAVLNAWIDFNQDGDWDDNGEQIFVDQALSGGDNNLTAAIPADATVGQATARFRVSSVAGYGVSGLAVDGEVEDYFVTIAAASRSAGRRPSTSMLAFGTRTVVEGNSVTAKSRPDFSSVTPTRTEVVDEAIVVVAPSNRTSFQEVADHNSSIDKDLIDHVFEKTGLCLRRDCLLLGDTDGL